MAWRVERSIATFAHADNQGSRQGSAQSSAALSSLPHWAGEPPRVKARQLLASDDYDPAQVERLLELSTRNQPLYAPTWMDLAELAYRTEQPQRALHFAAIASRLWPNRAKLMWRMALLQIKLRRPTEALATLAGYWRANPDDSAKTLALARRLQPDPQALVAALLRAKPREDLQSADYHRRLLSFGRRVQDSRLTHEVWQHTAAHTQQQRNVLFPYVDFMLAQEKYQWATQAWRQASGGEAKFALHNGTFEQPIADGGLGWKLRKGRGYRLSRDNGVHYDGQHSLHVHFDGTENMSFDGLKQLIVVEPGARYRVSGQWRGRDVTTRSGLFVRLDAVGGESRVGVGIDPRWGTWGWQQFNLEIAVPADTHQLLLSVQRRPTTALDKLIAGDLWLDGLAIAHVDDTHRP